MAVASAAATSASPQHYRGDLKMLLDNGLLNVLMVYAPHSGKPEEEKEFLERIVPFGEFITDLDSSISLLNLFSYIGPSATSLLLLMW